MRCERLQRLRDVGVGVVLVALVFSAQGADDVVRTPLPDGNPFPISAAVTVRGDLDTVYVSGALPTVVDKNAPKGSIAAFGDMETKTVSTLNAVKSSLARLGLDMSHVVKMTVFMVGDPSKDNKVGASSPALPFSSGSSRPWPRHSTASHDWPRGCVRAACMRSANRVCRSRRACLLAIPDQSLRPAPGRSQACPELGRRAA